MAKREFLMLAHEYDPEKHGVSGSFWSEKLDGIRAFWDGGITRGLPKYTIPWANTAKDERYREQQVATGLWSRYGNVIHAPNWWLDKLPNIPLDGELWVGRTQGDRQRCKSITGKIDPDANEWREVSFNVFNSPPLETVFEDGRINNPNFVKTLSHCMEFARDRMKIHPLAWYAQRAVAFKSVLAMMEKYVGLNEAVRVHPQHQLPFAEDQAREQVEQASADIIAQGGEGVIVMAPYALWVPERVKFMLKVKQCADSEAIVTGYTAGEETDKGSKLRGLMGAMIVSWQGKTFKLSGFTDDERALEAVDPNTAGANQWAYDHPGEELPSWIQAADFPRGSLVTFKYRGLTRDGIPNEARYWRPA